jgi:integrase
VAEVAKDFLQHQARRRKSVNRMRGSMERYILPALGERKMRSVSRTDAQALHKRITAQGKPIHANRVLSLLSALWSYHENTRPRDDENEPARQNPCTSRLVERNKETKRKRYLSPAELGRLGEALAAAEESYPSAVLALRLLVLTGARKTEILTLRREQVDFHRGVAYLADSKTGAKDLPLGDAALALLEQAPTKEGNPYVCPGKGAGPLVAIYGAWEEIRRAAGLGDDVHIHDLRHTFASVGVGAGYGLPVIGSILGHTNWSTTQRYAHLGDSPVRAAVNSISAEIGAKLLPGKVVPFRQAS